MGIKTIGASNCTWISHSKAHTNLKMKYGLFSVLYNASFDGYGNCVASKCTNGSEKKVAERCASLQIPLCGL
jgi:hypothetical protein